MNRYQITLDVTEINDKKTLKILIPIGIWLVFVVGSLLLSVFGPKDMSDTFFMVFGLMMFMFIPVITVTFIFAFKRRKQLKKRIDAVFDVVDGKVFLFGREVVISINATVNTKYVDLTYHSAILFNMSTGYGLKGDERVRFIHFVADNNIPACQEGMAWPKNPIRLPEADNYDYELYVHNR